jgi:hypothetical protein
MSELVEIAGVIADLYQHANGKVGTTSGAVVHAPQLLRQASVP